MPGAEGVQEAARTQSERIYIGRRQATMDHWVALRPLFEVCARKIWYEGGGHKRNSWWLQEASEKQLWATLAHLREAKRSKNGRDTFIQ